MVLHGPALLGGGTKWKLEGWMAALHSDQVARHKQAQQRGRFDLADLLVPSNAARAGAPNRRVRKAGALRFAPAPAPPPAPAPRPPRACSARQRPHPHPLPPPPSASLPPRRRPTTACESASLAAAAGRGGKRRSYDGFLSDMLQLGNGPPPPRLQPAAAAAAAAVASAAAATPADEEPLAVANLVAAATLSGYGGLSGLLEASQLVQGKAQARLDKSEAWLRGRERSPPVRYKPCFLPQGPIMPPSSFTSNMERILSSVEHCAPDSGSDSHSDPDSCSEGSDSPESPLPAGSLPSHVATFHFQEGSGRLGMAAPGVAMSNPLHPRFDDADADVPTSAHPPQTPAVGAADDASAEHADDVPNPPPPPPPRQRSALLLLAVAVAVALPVSNAAQLYAHSDSLVTLELRGHDGRAASYHKGWKTGLAADGSGSDPSVLQFLEDGCAARGNVSALLEAAFPAMWLPAATRPFALRALLWGKTGRLARGGGGGDRSDKQPPRMCFWAAVAYVPAGILVWWVFFFNAYFYGRLCELPSFANGAGVAMQAGAPLDAAYNATQLPYFAFDADGHAALEHVSSHVNLHASAFFGLLLDTGVAVCLAFYAHVLASPCAASSPQRAASTARAGASQVLLYARGIAVVLVPLALTGVLANSSRNYVVYAVEQLRAAPTLSGAAAAATTTADDLSAVPAGNPLPHVVFQGLSFATSVWTDTALYAVPTWRFAPSADANTSLSLLPDGGGFGSGGDIACSNPAGILVLLQLTVFAAFPLSVLAAFHSWYAALGPWHGRHGFVPTAAVPLATVAAMAAVHAVVLHSADCTDAAGQAVSPSATRHPCPLLWATAVYAGVLLADAICVLGNAAGAAAALPAYATLAEAEAASAEDVAGRENGAAAGAEEGGSQQLELSSGVTEEAR